MPSLKKSELVSNESSSEKCGFVCHMLCLPLTFLYFVWIWVPDDVLHAADITYYPEKSWSITIPVYISCLFVAAPIIYSIINRLSVPRVDSIDTVRDDFTRLPPEATSLSSRITTYVQRQDRSILLYGEPCWAQDFYLPIRYHFLPATNPVCRRFTTLTWAM
jgi:hypothetical protein